MSVRGLPYDSDFLLFSVAMSMITARVPTRRPRAALLRNWEAMMSTFGVRSVVLWRRSLSEVRCNLEA